MARFAALIDRLQQAAIRFAVSPSRSLVTLAQPHKREAEIADHAVLYNGDLVPFYSGSLVPVGRTPNDP